MNINDNGFIRKEEYQIMAYHLDMNWRVTIPFLLNMMQDAASYHATQLGVGYEVLRERNLMWVLSRQYLKIMKYPGWGDKITVVTWPSGKERISWLRDFKLLNEQNELIGVGTTSWFSIDLDRRRPKRIDSIFNVDTTGCERVVGDVLGKIEPVQQNGISKSFEIGFRDLDMHQHVNNVKYIEWILESFPLEIHQNQILREFEINYLAESFYGEQISVFNEANAERDFRHSVVRKSDQKELCRARTVWENN